MGDICVGVPSSHYPPIKTPGQQKMWNTTLIRLHRFMGYFSQSCPLAFATSRRQGQTVIWSTYPQIGPTQSQFQNIFMAVFFKAARYRLHRLARITLSYRGNVMCGRQYRSHSKTLSVSQRWSKKRSMVDTRTLKYRDIILSMYCSDYQCIWPSITIAIALPLWTCARCGITHINWKLLWNILWNIMFLSGEPSGIKQLNFGNPSCLYGTVLCLSFPINVKEVKFNSWFCIYQINVI